MTLMAASGPHPDPAIRVEAAGWLRHELQRTMGAGLAGMALLVPMVVLLIAIQATGSSVLSLLALLVTATACLAIIAGFRFCLASLMLARLAGPTPSVVNPPPAWRVVLLAPIGGLTCLLTGAVTWLFYGTQTLGSMGGLIVSVVFVTALWGLLGTWLSMRRPT